MGYLDLQGYIGVFQRGTKFVSINADSKVGWKGVPLPGPDFFPLQDVSVAAEISTYLAIHANSHSC